MNFNYLARIVSDASIDIDNIKECGIIAYNDHGEEFYLIITTALGNTRLFSQGPISPNGNISDNVKCEYHSFATDDRKIKSFIYKWLNEKEKEITQAEEIDIDELRQKLVNIAEYI